MIDISHQLSEHVPRLRRYACRLLGSRDQADDLLQDCLVRAMERGHLWQPGTNLQAWLLTIMHNLFIDRCRRSASRPKLASIDEEGLQIPCRPNQIDSIELKTLLLSLNALPESQRMAVLMVGLEGHSYEEASIVMNVPVGTVRSRLSRGRASLRLAAQVDGRTTSSGEAKIAALDHPPRDSDLAGSPSAHWRQSVGL